MMKKRPKIPNKRNRTIILGFEYGKVEPPSWRARRSEITDGSNVIRLTGSIERKIWR